MPDKRSKGQRRWGFDQAFPVKDCDGIVVVSDRRQLRDRRLLNTRLEDRLMMFSEMPVIIFDPVENDQGNTE